MKEAFKNDRKANDQMQIIENLFKEWQMIKIKNANDRMHMIEWAINWIAKDQNYKIILNFDQPLFDLLS